MLDVPVLFWMTATLMCLDRFVKTAKPLHIWATAALMTVAMLTKQHAIVLAPALLCGILFGFKRKHWTCWHLYPATLLFALITTAYYVFTLGNITSSWRDMSDSSGNALTAVLGFLSSIGPIAVVAGLLGVARCLLSYKTWTENVSLVWIAGVVLFFSLTGVKTSRYLIYMTPPLVILAATVMGGGIRAVPQRLSYVTVIVLGALAVWSVSNRDHAKLTGYQQAAKQAIVQSESRPVLFGGSLDGDFILYSRLANADLREVVLRADKITGGGNILPDREYTAFVASYEELANKIRNAGVATIVLEDKPGIDSIEQRWLWDFASRECQMMGSIPVTLPSGRTASLRFYRNNPACPVPHSISLPMLTLSKTKVECDLSRRLLEWP